MHLAHLPSVAISQMHQYLSAEVPAFKHLRDPDQSVDRLTRATAYLAATLSSDPLESTQTYLALAMGLFAASDFIPSPAQNFSLSPQQIDTAFRSATRAGIQRHRFQSYPRLPNLYKFLSRDRAFSAAFALYLASKVDLVENGVLKPAFFQRKQLAGINVYQQAAENTAQATLNSQVDERARLTELILDSYEINSTQVTAELITERALNELMAKEPIGGTTARIDRWIRALNPLLVMLSREVRIQLDLYKPTSSLEGEFAQAMRKIFVWTESEVSYEIAAIAASIYRSFLSPIHPRVAGRPVQSLFATRLEQIENHQPAPRPAHLADSLFAHETPPPTASTVYSPAPKPSPQNHLPRSLSRPSSNMRPKNNSATATDPLLSAPQSDSMDSFKELVSVDRLLRTHKVPTPDERYRFTWSPRSNLTRTDVVIFSQRFLNKSNSTDSSHKWSEWVEGFIHGLRHQSTTAFTEVKLAHSKSLWRVRLDRRLGRALVGRQKLPDGTTAWVFLSVVSKEDFQRLAGELARHQGSWIDLVHSH